MTKKNPLRIAIDLQAAQTAPATEGAGRHALLLAQALARHGEHHVQIVLNGRFGKSVPVLRSAFDGLVAPEDVVVFNVPGPNAEQDPANAWRRQASLLIRENVLARLRPDIVHVTDLFNGFDDDAVTSIGRPRATPLTGLSLQQLIAGQQALQPADELDSASLQRSWYCGKLQAVRNADLVLAASTGIKLDALNILQLPAERILDIGAAADPYFVKRMTDAADLTFLHRHQLEKPYVLCMAGTHHPGDAVDWLIEAIALLPQPLRSQHQLAIAGTLASAHQTRLETIVAQLGISPGTVVFTGTVDQQTLSTLYNGCALFIDLGLSSGSAATALEAMACGAPVIAARGSAAAVAVGLDEASFAANADAVASKLFEVLSSEAMGLHLGRGGPDRARAFSWDGMAATTLAGYADLHERTQPRPAAVAVAEPAVARPSSEAPSLRLAFISPLPPLHTGIADYSAMLLPQLARYYDIEIVTDQPVIDVPWIAGNFPVRSLSWFEQHADTYDRVLYHFGNSNFHLPMFDLLERHPGVVVLHDFYLSGVLGGIDPDLSAPHAYLRALYDSHGYQGLADYARIGLNASIWKYPSNKRVLDHATGVIVHSHYPRQLADQWYGSGSAAHWHTIPLLRAASVATDRDAARALVDLPSSAFLTCSFGMIGPTKQNARLLEAWLASSLADDENCYLVFVGELEPQEYGAEMRRAIAESGLASRIRITGFASHTLYQAFLACADIAVQLRTMSRGETSASILDCLAYGVATIVNANGAAAELAGDLLLKLPDKFEPDELTAALTLLWQDPALRAGMAQRAAAHVATVHHPAIVSDAYRDAIEEIGRSGPSAQYRRMVDAIAAITPVSPPSPQDLADTAAAIASNTGATPQHQLLVDISALVQVDLKTGIQRVVRSIVSVLINSPPAGFRVEPVYDVGGYYVYARKFTTEMAGTPGIGLEDTPVEFRTGDTFLGLDLYMVLAINNRRTFEDMRNRGVATHFVVFDLLPALMPNMFPGDTAGYYCLWLEFIIEIGSSLICISRSVADEAAHWIETTRPVRHGPTRIGYFHLGADIVSSHPSFGLTHDAQELLELVTDHPSVLMVGTVEPRKGHSQALDAFDLLWAQNIDMILVIVGNEGWMTELLVERLKDHPLRGTKLFWLKGISDEMLLQLYEHCSVLLAASEGEGFGLPLIEAAQHGLPIIARDLPVFREVAGEHATFFASAAPAALAEALRDWVILDHEGNAPQSTGMPWLTWAESTAELLNVIDQEQWYRVVP
ncbi:MAG: glycosyltransferase [Herminiimonas sp.]|nr:glycosyltransferase [Herminiimonas sp.]